MKNGMNMQSNTPSMQTGMSTAIVTDNVDPEKLGRVKLQFPWSSDDSESAWARVSTFMAGEEQGFYFIPEIGQEVLVTFIHGDIEYPIVIGTLWNADSMPPQVDDNDTNDIGKIRSRSGHEIVFNDNSDGDTKLEITSSLGHKIVLDDADSGKIEISSSGGHYIVMDDSGITIEDSGGSQIKMESSSGEVTIKSGMSISLESGGNVDIKAGGVLTLEGALVRIN